MPNTYIGTDSYEDLLSNGARYVYVLWIQGIPWLFPETLPERVDSISSPDLPSSGDALDGVCPALMFEEGATNSIESDRETGFGRGDAIKVILSWEALEKSGLTTGLFRQPSRKVRLAVDVDGDDLLFDTESNAGWSNGDRAYIGHESFLVTIPDGPKAATGFGLTTRPEIPYAYRASSPTTFSYITDRPEVWKRRFVAIHRHLLTPAGYIMDTEWLAGTYHREVWRGFIDEVPKPGEFGMELRCLPLCRLPALQLGHDLAAEVVVPDPDDHYSFANIPVFPDFLTQLIIEGEYTGGGGGTFRIAVVSTQIVMTIQAWAAVMQSTIDTALSGQPWYTANTVEFGVSGMVTGPPSYHADAYAPGMIKIMIPYNAGGGYNVTEMRLTVPPSGGYYWLTPGQRDGKKGLNAQPNWAWDEGWPGIALDYRVGSWLPVVQTSGEGYADLEIPSSGFGVLEVEGERELIRWDFVEPVPAPSAYIRLLRIAQRGVNATPLLDLAKGAKLKFVSGHYGKPAEVILTLLESSGTGTRGTYDTLALGMGYGIPEAWIDVESFTSKTELMEESIAAFGDGRVSLEELMGGWLALHGLCVVQRRRALDMVETATAGAMDSDTPYQLTCVRVDPAGLAVFTDFMVSLSASDVEMGGVGLPDTLQGATEVRVSRSGVDRTLPDVMPQDVPAIQALGVESRQYSAPGMSESVARDAAMSRIGVGLGQTVRTYALMPWLNAQVGDVLIDETAHKKVYDWSTGTRGPVQVSARVSGTREMLRTGRVQAALLGAGIASEGLYLCPTSTVREVISTTDFRSEAGDPWRFRGPNKVILYNPGNEAAGEFDTFEVGVTDSALGTWYLGTGTLPAWVTADVTRMTFPEYSDGSFLTSLLEESHMYYLAAKRWGL